MKIQKSTDAIYQNLSPKLFEAVKYWYEKTKSQVTFEVVIWKGINDKQVDIDTLIAYCKQVPSKENLIEYNTIGDDQFLQQDQMLHILHIRHHWQSNFSNRTTV